MTAQTIQLTREMFHCPPWCAMPLEEHERDLSGWEGGALHRSSEIPLPSGGGVYVHCSTDPIGRLDVGVDAPQVVVDGAGGDEFTAEQTRTLASILLDHAEMIEGMT